MQASKRALQSYEVRAWREEESMRTSIWEGTHINLEAFPAITSILDRIRKRDGCLGAQQDWYNEKLSSTSVRIYYAIKMDLPDEYTPAYPFYTNPERPKPRKMLNEPWRPGCSEACQ